MTNIAVKRSAVFTAEDRSWLAGPHGTEPGTNPSITLDVSAFTTQIVDGYIPSGTAVSKLASGLWGPFDKLAASGEHCLTFSTVKADEGDVGTGGLIHGFVYASKLPGSPVLADLRAALPLIHFSA